MNKIFNFYRQSVVLVLFFCGLQVANAGISEARLKQLQLPAGFTISLYADDVPGARSLSLADNGVVFAGSHEGNVYALQDNNKDGKVDQRYIIATGLYLPNGVAFRNGSLYVAEVNRIIRFDNILQQLSSPPKPVVVYDQFPGEKHHGWKYLRFGPDGRLYTAVGAPCNVCDPKKKVFTSLIRLNADGSGMEILARGIRNTVGFDWQPGSNHLYFSENGRDHLGDNEPPDELNRWTSKDSHYGYPYCHGGDILDPKFGKGRRCENYHPPVWNFKAHMAPLGMRFYRGKQFPSVYQQQLFVAQHGSWNRTVPHGYRVAMVKFKGEKAISERVFAQGWLRDNGEVWGRPVDILELPDGSLLVSDDHAGVIYKISYQR